MRYLSLILIGMCTMGAAQSFSWAVQESQTASQVASSQDSATAVSRRLLAIDQRLKVVSDQQKQIAAKNEEIKNELKNLRVWIFHRGGGVAPS